MSWLSRLTGAEAEPECPPDCVKCAESESIDPNYVPASEPEEDR